jgi:hypothetical protein
MLHDAGQGLLICLIVVGLIAFRLVWGHPAFRVMIRYFPKNWQAWLLDEHASPSEKEH